MAKNIKYGKIAHSGIIQGFFSRDFENFQYFAKQIFDSPSVITDASCDVHITQPHTFEEKI